MAINDAAMLKELRTVLDTEYAHLTPYQKEVITEKLMATVELKWRDDPRYLGTALYVVGSGDTALFLQKYPELTRQVPTPDQVEQHRTQEYLAAHGKAPSAQTRVDWMRKAQQWSDDELLQAVPADSPALKPAPPKAIDFKAKEMVEATARVAAMRPLTAVERLNAERARQRAEGPNA